MIGSTIVRSIAGQVNAVKAAVLAVLAADNGAGMVGFTQAGAGAAALSALAKMRQAPSVLDYIPSALHAGIAARTDVTDLTAYIDAAYAKHKRLRWPGGLYHATVVNLSAIYGGGILGDGHADGGATDWGQTEIRITADNSPGVRVWGPVVLQDFIVSYANQQTTAHVNSRGIELNNVAYASFRNLRVNKANTSYGIPQAAFGATTYNAMFACEWSNVTSTQASQAHYDFRNFGGGGTNCSFDMLYANGGGSLDFSSFGQPCEYVIRGGNWSGYDFRAVSIDGVSFNQSVLDGQNLKASFGTLRMESCRTTKNGGFWYDLGGGHAQLRVGVFEAYNCRSMAADGVNSTTVFHCNATEFDIEVEAVRFAYSAGSVLGDVFTTATRRFCRTGGGSENAAFNNSQFYDELGVFGTPWTDDSAATRTVSPVRTFAGRRYSERTGNTLGGATSTRIVYLQTNQAPGSAAWAAGGGLGTKPWLTGDQIDLQDAGDFGRVKRWFCQVGGTPGTWTPTQFVGGLDSAAFPADADFTYTPLTSRPTIYYGTALTANRTVTLDATNAWNGCRVRVVRAVAASGAFALDVGGLKSLAVGQWCDVLYVGTGWRLVASGAL